MEGFFSSYRISYIFAPLSNNPALCHLWQKMGGYHLPLFTDTKVSNWLLLEWILQNQAGHLVLFTQQKSYHFYTTEILFLKRFEGHRFVSRIVLLRVTLVKWSLFIYLFIYLLARSGSKMSNILIGCHLTARRVVDVSRL